MFNDIIHSMGVIYMHAESSDMAVKINNTHFNRNIASNSCGTMYLFNVKIEISNSIIF